MKSYIAKPEEIERKWYVVDAAGKPLGRVASQVAAILRGKNKPIFTPSVDTGDFVIIINAEKVLLTGKKFQAKRNHLNSFLNEYREFEARQIRLEDIPACLAMNDEWCRLMGCNQDVGLEQETCAVHRAFNSFGELGLEGLMILIDGKIVAYTLGELLTKNTWLVHVEKAFQEFRGAYQAINQLFVRYAMEKYPHVEYINREDDSGDMGLRIAKMSYHPAFFVEKYPSEGCLLLYFLCNQSNPNR